MNTGYKQKYHHWTRIEERMIQKAYISHRWWGRKDLADELGVTEAALEGHIRLMKRGGRL